jgi:DNA repair exonuclease SbcCD ATPase subunit
MIRFLSIEWKNILSTGNYWTRIDLNASQNTLIVGENGSGKSTILDALCFALYNKPFRNITKPALLNSINQKEALVKVEFTTDNHAFKIVRGIKPNIFEIFKDGVLQNQEAEAKDYQGHLEKFILKLNYKSFTQIVILGSASFTPFMQLSASDRRAIIEDLLDIQIFSVMNGLVKEKSSGIVAQRNENRLLIEGTNEKIAIQERYLSEMQQDHEKLILEHQKEHQQHTEEINRLAANIMDCKHAISSLSTTILDKTKIEAAIKKVTQLEAQIENVSGKHIKSVQFFEAHDNCPTCTQVIDTTFKIEHVSELNEKIKECAKGLIQLEDKFLVHQARLSEIHDIEAAIDKKKHELAVDTTSVSQIKKFISKLNEKISGLQGTHHSVEREQERLETHRHELVQLEESKKTLVEQSAYYEVAGSLLKDTGIKTKIIRQYLPIINMFVNKHLAQMDFFVNFNLDDTFKETIKSRHRDEFTYPSFSEGEKQRIDMALMLTWRAVAKLKNSVNTNLLILDEIFDSSMDTTGAEELMKILHSLDTANVFVISHRGDILGDKFQRVIRFQKNQNFSHIVT